MKMLVMTVTALLGATSAAHADTGTPPAVANSVMPQVAAKPEKRYCIVQKQTTGSRIPRKTCETRKDWIARGVDPLAPNN